MMNIYEKLRDDLSQKVQEYKLSGQNISIRCKALSAVEAIGNPEHDDYPIIKGREVMVEAVFQGAKGQAFADEYENIDYLVEDLLNMELTSNRRRASFIAGLNAIYRHLGLCNKTVHCKDAEPLDCANHLPEVIGPRKKILLIGHQPRFLEILASHYSVRAVDMDLDNIGSEFSGVIIEPPEVTPDAIKWCDLIFATGSTLINGTITDFINQGKPALFYGVTISAAAEVLNLNTYCHCGH